VETRSFFLSVTDYSKGKVHFLHVLDSAMLPYMLYSLVVMHGLAPVFLSIFYMRSLKFKVFRWINVLV